MNYKENVYIYQHMGLGDHLICNGLIRKIISIDPTKTYCLFVKSHNIGSVSFMYRDIPNLYFMLGSDSDVINFINSNNLIDRLKIVGFNWVDPASSFESNFYKQHGFDIQEKWLSFRCDRDHELENRLYDHFNINEDYIFVHDDHRYKLDEKRLPSDIRVIRPNPDIVNNIFAYAKVMELAKELHLMESCFAFMADNMNINPNTTIHRYVRNPPEFEIPLYRTVKEILV